MALRLREVTMFAIRQGEARTLTYWNARRSQIDMSPPYQRRGGLWSASDKAFLIDSILNGYDIPKVYIADFTYRDSPLNSKRLQYAMIDGKQRFEAIFDFFDGNVVLDSTFIYDDNPKLRLAGLGYKDLRALHPEVAERFENFNLSVVSVITDEEDKIAELFVRLNRNKSLTGAEIRNAMAGPIPGLIRDIAGHRLFTFNVRFTVKRGQDLNAAAKLLLVEYRNELVDVKKTDLDRFVLESLRLESPVFDFEQAKNRALKILDDMAAAFVSRDPLLSSQGPLVVYYWLARGINASQRTVMREFLLSFENERRQNRHLVKRLESQSLAPSGDAGVDFELLRYDSLNRSTNDEGSLKGRSEILIKRFEKWLADNAAGLEIGIQGSIPCGSTP